MSKIYNSYDVFFKNENLDFNKTEKIVNESLRKADDGELFLEFKQSENFTFDNKKIKNASSSTEKGFGLRSVKDDTSAYSHSSEISEKNIKNSGKVVQSILSSPLPPESSPHAKIYCPRCWLRDSALASKNPIDAPPSTVRREPVTKLAAGEQRNTAA